MGNQTNAKRLRAISYIITLSSFAWGYGISVLNVCIVDNAKGSLLNSIFLTDSEKQTATTLALIGAWIGALIINRPVEIYGRKPTLLLTNIFYILGGVLCALASSKYTLFCGRLIVGIAMGFVTGIVPMLLTEIAPDDVRGQITTLHQLQLTLGIFASGIVGYIFVSDITAGWRYCNAFIIVPCVLQIFLQSWVPESPKWLANSNKRTEARTWLTKLRMGIPQDQLDQEMEELFSGNTDKEYEKKEPSWSQVFYYKRQLIIGSLLVFFQAMTGINSVIFYSSTIFGYAGVNHPIAATTSVGVVNVLMTVVSIYLVDSYGRRRLLLIGTSVMGFSLVFMSTSLLVLNNHPSSQGIIAVISTLTYVAGFAMGLGAVVWVILGEIFPTSVRSKAMTLFMGISYACNIFVGICTLSVIKALGTGTDPEKNGISKLYLICSLLSFVAVAIIYSRVPETKGQALPECVVESDSELILET